MIETIIARLKDQVPALRLVEGAADFAALSGQPPKVMPAAYVMPMRDTAEANNLIGAHRQRVTETIGVVLVTSNRSDSRGAAAAVAIDTLYTAARAALVGWEPAAELEPMSLVDGVMIGLKDGAVYWQERYSTRFTLRAS